MFLNIFLFFYLQPNPSQQLTDARMYLKNKQLKKEKVQEKNTTKNRLY